MTVTSLKLKKLVRNANFRKSCYINPNLKICLTIFYLKRKFYFIFRMASARDLIKLLLKLKSVKRAKQNAPYVGIKPGLYGDGDKLLGVTMPDIRKTVKDFQSSLTLTEIQVLFDSEYHEVRMAGVITLLYCYKKCTIVKDKKRMYEFYISNVHSNKINNWDFIDISAPHIPGVFLYEKPDHGRRILIGFAQSKNLWMRRVAILSTFYHIKQNEFDMTIELGKLLLQDEHHLIHKAVGWMLREIGKRNQETLLKFLDDHSKEMPRIMLSYATEKLSPEERKHYRTTQK